jgi:phage terminase large subunit-like protein
VDRATPLKNAILDGKIGLVVNDESRAKILEQLKSFPLGRHDDIIDSMAYAFNELQKAKDSNITTGGTRHRRRMR